MQLEERSRYFLRRGRLPENQICEDKPGVGVGYAEFEMPFKCHVEKSSRQVDMLERSSEEGSGLETKI